MSRHTAPTSAALLTAAATCQVTRFCRQYWQAEPKLDFPDDAVLRTTQAQQALHDELWAAEPGQHGLPARYQTKTLKELVRKIEAAVTDWEKQGLSDGLATALSRLVVLPGASEDMPCHPRSRITYFLDLLGGDAAKGPSHAPSITLLESRSLLAASGTTGLRTWEAALHLGQYLCTNRALVRGKNMLELGAGTGYLSVLGAGPLGASYVLATDGSAKVVANLADNAFINGFESAGGNGAVLAETRLEWGHALVGEEWEACPQMDLVLGADITYDAGAIPSLVGTLDELVARFPGVLVLIAATERNRRTYDAFLTMCNKKSFQVEQIDFPVPKRRDQNGPFYDDALPIHICQLKTTQARHEEREETTA